MRNVLIELIKQVANKAAAAVVSLTDPSDVASTLKACQYTLKMKRNSIRSKHIHDDAFRKSAEKGPHKIAKQPYDNSTVGRLLEKAYNFRDSIFGLKANLKLLHMSQMSLGIACN